MPRPSKYERLGAFLSGQERSLVSMSFREIERVLQATLPPSKRQRAWWSNNASNNVMTRQWLAAGYETEQVDIIGERLVFRRVRPAAENAALRPARVGEDAGSPPRDPIFGCMEGTLVLPEDIDLTAPADPDWGKAYEDG